MSFKVITQRRFIRGLSASTGDFSQAPNTVPRISNLVYTRRGSLSTCDGSLIISLFNGALQTNFGNWLEIFLLKPTGLPNTYHGVFKDPGTQFAVNVISSAVDSGAGNLFAGTYRWKVTALDGAGGETTGSGSFSIAVGANRQITVTWAATIFATGYNLYRTKVNGAVGSEVLVASNIQSTSYLDNIADANLGTQMPPTVNTTQISRWVTIPATSYGYANTVKQLPADPAALDNTPGGAGGGGSGSGGGTGTKGPTPSGGIVGNISPLPLMLQFLDQLILCPGNGYNPLIYNPALPISGTNPEPIANTFSPVYPKWVANTVYVVGDTVVPNPDDGHFFTCIQGGTSGGAQPTFNATSKAKTQDGSILWQEAGSTAATAAPRGAAHGIVHFGSLWLANTYASNTTDGLDGPTALRMSDLNNPNSWNPVNVGFIGKDDGQQITGLATFTIGEFGIAPTGSLVVFKDFSTYQIIGVFGASNFSIQQAQTDLGCIASRTIQFLPGFGIARFTHLGIAIFDGVKDRLISDDIRPYLFEDEGSAADILGIDWNYAYFMKGAQTADPPMYVMAAPIRAAVLSGVTAQYPFLVPPGSVGVPSGNYYFKVTVFTPDGEVAISPEFGPYFTDGSQKIVLIGVPTYTNATKWRIYYNTTSQQENTYVEYTEAQVAGLGRLINFMGTGLNPQFGTPGFGTLTRLFCYDLVLKAWTIIDLPWAISVLRQVRAQGIEPLTITGGFFDGSVRRIQADDQTWDGTPVAWNFRTAEVFGKNATDRIYFRRLVVRGVGDGTAIQVIVTISNQDGTQTNLVNYPIGAGRFEANVAIGLTGINAHATVSGTGSVEIEALEWQVMPKPAGVPVAI